MSIINDRRIGRFHVNVEMINNSPDACRAVFAKVIILDATVRVHSDDIEYVGICDAFAPLAVGDAIPLYHPYLASKCDENGNTSIKLVGWH